MRLAKSRDWSDAEVQEAVAAIKAEPGLWAELENIEKTTGESNGTEVGFKELQVLARLHSGCELHLATVLSSPVVSSFAAWTEITIFVVANVFCLDETPIH
jgi:hypothetical protein